MRHISLLSFGGGVLSFHRSILFPPPLRFAEGKQGGYGKQYPPMLAAQYGFPSGPLAGFHKMFDQLIWR
jgi:hypothetical protein